MINDTGCTLGSPGHDPYIVILYPYIVMSYPYIIMLYPYVVMLI